MSGPYRTRLQLTPKTKVKTQTRQRLVVSGSVLAVALLFGIGAFMYGNFGNSTESFAAISSNMGFENSLTDWTSVSGTWAINSTAANYRSGTKSVKNTANTTSDKQLSNTACTIAVPASGTNYITVSAWIKASSTNGRVRFAIYDVTASAETVSPSYYTTTTAFAYSSYTFSAINGHTYYPILNSKNNTSGSVDIYFDDVMSYTATASTVDVTAPTAPSAVSATCSGTSNTLNFTQGTDASSGVDGILILRQAGLIATDQAVTNQTAYSTTSTTGPTSVGSYSVVYNGSSVSTFTDNPGSAGSYTYLIYMRDKNYNYTALTSAARIWVMNGSSLSVTVAASSGIDGFYIPAGNTLTIGSAATLTIRSGSSFTVSGTLKLQGIITNNGTITFANGSTFDYNRNGSATAGTGIPTATWASGSTCQVTGVTNIVPLNTGQTFHHFTWNCITQTGNVILSTNFNCNGNLTITNSKNGGSLKTVWLDGVNHIKGNISASLTSNINFDYGSLIYLDGTSLQNIDNMGADLWFENVTINNAAGVKLLDNVLVDSMTILRNGNVDLNAKTWSLENMATIQRENGTMSAEPYPYGYYDLTYKNECTTGGELVATYTDAVYRLRLDLTGTVTLAKNAYVNYSLTFVSGKLATGSFEVKMMTTSTSSISGYGINSYINGNLRRTVGASGAYIFPVGSATTYQPMTITLVLQLGISNILGFWNSTAPTSGALSGITVNGIVVGNMLNAGYWTMTPNATMTFGTYTASGSASGYTNTGLSTNTSYFLLKRHDASSSWQALGTQIPIAGQLVGGVLQATSSLLTTWSDFGAGYGGGSTLPITLSSFNVNLVDNSYANLQWVTSAELNNEYFDVQRSADGKTFESIGRVEGMGTSLVRHDYELNDPAPLDGLSYYRLKQVDFDGTFSYSPIESLNNAQVVLTADDVNVFPNPATTEINVAVQMKKEGDQEIQIIDLAGRMVYSQTQSFYEGQNQFKMPLDNLPTGFYFVKFSSDGSEPVLKKFLKN